MIIVRRRATHAVGDKKVLHNQVEMLGYMKFRANEDIRGAGGDQSKPPRSTIIIRADKETPFEKVYAVLKSCRLAGYERVQLRAIRYNVLSEG